VQSWTSDTLPYNGSATEIAYLRFEGNAGTDNALLAGYWLDNMVVNSDVTGGEGEGEGEGEVEQGNTILSNVYPPFIDVGTIVVLTGPQGTDFQWRKGGVDIDGATNRVLVFDPVTQDDAGIYTVQYNDGLKAVVVSEPFNMVVQPEGSVPAAGVLGLVALAGACGLGGARLIRRRR
jgi:hypothetical protein